VVTRDRRDGCWKWGEEGERTQSSKYVGQASLKIEFTISAQGLQAIKP
jgi:hypothetical protein